MNTQSFINVKYKDLLAVAALNGKSIYENEFNRLSNLPFIRKKAKNHVTIQEIFKHSWDDFKRLSNKPIRDLYTVL